MTFRDQLFRRYRESRNADAWKAYKEARRSVKQLLKNAECDHIRTEVKSHKDNPGSLWKIINTCILSKEKKLRSIVETLSQLLTISTNFCPLFGETLLKLLHSWP